MAAHLSGSIGDLEEDAAENEAKDGGADDKPSVKSSGSRSRGRQPLPAHLPRERAEHEAACACPSCNGSKLSRIGADEREVLDYVPYHFKVMVQVRPKMTCLLCEMIIESRMPSLSIDRGRPGPALLVSVLAAKYGDHLPL